MQIELHGAINTFERENMFERQREGIAIAVKNGAYKGRKEIDYPSNWVAVYNKYRVKSQ